MLARNPTERDYGRSPRASKDITSLFYENGAGLGSVDIGRSEIGCVAIYYSLNQTTNHERTSHSSQPSFRKVPEEPPAVVEG
jgi:hypothetical protein